MRLRLQSLEPHFVEGDRGYCTGEALPSSPFSRGSAWTGWDFWNRIETTKHFPDAISRGLVLH